MMEQFTFEDIRQHGWPQCIRALFPMFLIFYRRSKPKERRIKAGVKGNGKINPVTGKEGHTTLYKPPKSQATRQQNNYSYAAVVLNNPDDCGTVLRAMKHRGFFPIGIDKATTQEADNAKEGWRYRIYKYKTLGELHNLRGVVNEEWKRYCDVLQTCYPSRASGQLRLL